MIAILSFKKVLVYLMVIYFMDKNKNTLKQFWHLINLNKADIGSIYFYAILSGILQLSVPIGIQSIIGYVLGASMVSSIYILIFLVTLGVFIVGLLQINQMKIIEKLQQLLFVNYAFEFIDKIPKIEFYKKVNYYIPEKVNRFLDINILQKGFSKLLLEIPTAIIQIIFGLILLAIYHPIFIVFGLTLAIILTIVLYLSSQSGLDISIKESNYKYEMVSWMQEVGKSIKAFRYNQEAELSSKNTDNIAVNYLNSRTKHFNILLLQYKTLIAFKTFITAILLIIGVYLLINQLWNIGEFIAAEIVILIIINSVEKLILNLDTAYDVLTSLDKLSSVIESPEENQGSLEFSSNEISLELINFSFSYTNSHPILKNINLKIPKNSSVCIIGNENSGRSTLLNLLSMNYLNFTGNLLVNSIPIHNYNMNSLRKKVGICFNELEIFSGTVLENISLGRTDVTPEGIIAIAKELEFDNILQNFSQGFETTIDANGNSLPNSIAKKIILLRTLVHHPLLLILEEPWLGIEENYKQKLITYLLKKSLNSTVIISSNDLDFAKKCDYRFELKNGQLEFLN
jgi:ATP-binding cassette subfamily B protein